MFDAGRLDVHPRGFGVTEFLKQLVEALHRSGRNQRLRGIAIFALCLSVGQRQDLAFFIQNLAVDFQLLALVNHRLDDIDIIAILFR